MGKNYWMVVESLENHQITRREGFQVFGFGQTFRRRVRRMQRSDMVLFYVNTIRKWTATATITSGYFEDFTPIWTPTSRGEQYPFRVNLKPYISLEEEQYIDALILAPRLEYLKRWTPEDWPLAFADRLHLIPQRDFRLIESEMQRIASPRRRPSKRRRRQSRRQPMRAEPETFSPQSNGGANTTITPAQNTDSPGESSP